MINKLRKAQQQKKKLQKIQSQSILEPIYAVDMDTGHLDRQAHVLVLFSPVVSRDR